MTNRLRLYSGMVLFLFVTGHFLNLALGLISIDAMVAGSEVLMKPWHTIVGSILLLSAFLTHTGLSIWSIWVRRAIQLDKLHYVQIGLGLIAPLLLFNHVFGSRFIDGSVNYEPSFYTVLTMFWVVEPWRGIVQTGAVLIIWAHGCIGLDKWLRIYPVYNRLKVSIYFLFSLIPGLALAGYIAAGSEILDAAQQNNWVQDLFAKANLVPWIITNSAERETVFQIGFMLFLTSLFIGQYMRSSLAGRKKKPQLSYLPGEKMVKLIPDATLLESIRAAGIPHVAICGGNGRCSTCRVRVGKGQTELPSPTELETQVLSPAALAFSVRLACQLRPTNDIEVTALVKPRLSVEETIHPTGTLPAQEMDVAYLFVDIRNSTGLSEERLPFDVVYILNQFFAEMAEALTETNGHYAQFNGDGLMAIYGLTTGSKKGCMEAIEGAKAMFKRIETLNERLKSDLPDGLKIGIGIHTGGAVIGSMGPPDAPVTTALGDNVNIAARLETLTKEFGVPLVISALTAERSRLDVGEISKRSVLVKGRNRKVDVYAIAAPLGLEIKKKRKLDSSLPEQFHLAMRK